MAANTAKLFIPKFDSFKGGRSIATFGIRLYQATDEDGQLASVVRGGKINIKMRASHKEDAELYSWIVGPDGGQNAVEEGWIEFKDSDGVKIKRITFKDAYCVEFFEYWEDKESVTGSDSTEISMPHWVEITISSRCIENESSYQFANRWELINK